MLQMILENSHTEAVYRFVLARRNNNVELAMEYAFSKSESRISSGVIFICMALIGKELPLENCDISQPPPTTGDIVYNSYSGFLQGHYIYSTSPEKDINFHIFHDNSQIYPLFMVNLKKI